MQHDIKSKLMVYHDLLLKWQKSVNLVAPSTISDAWSRHFEDSYQILDFLPEGPFALADLGSGAGFPGLVIAIARPDAQVHLIESDTKKCAFLSVVSRETHADNVQVHNARVEAVLPGLEVDVITARALAPLSDLLRMCACQWSLESPSESPAKLVFMKGENWQDEVNLAKRDHVFGYSTKQSKTARSAAILCITKPGA